MQDSLLCHRLRHHLSPWKTEKNDADDATWKLLDRDRLVEARVAGLCADAPGTGAWRAPSAEAVVREINRPSSVSSEQGTRRTTRINQARPTQHRDEGLPHGGAGYDRRRCSLKSRVPHGTQATIDGDDLALEADAPPPLRLLAILGRGKRDIVGALRLRAAEERRRILQWVNDPFASSPHGVCAHCGDGPRPEDPFVLLFVGTDRGEVHSSCHSIWITEREAEARKALGLDARRAVTIAEPSSPRTGPQ